jgi:predicted DNA-binding antitoxin AbrB/MazE fold protein
MFHYTTRKRFIANLEKIDLRRGTDRVIKIILEEYDKRSVKSF